MKDENEFWLVWNPQRGMPTHRHRTHESAKQEAERLSRLARGQRFYVLRATDMLCTVDVVHVQLRTSDELPF
jgi:hypothetical protein